ncbi:MAG TPA: methyltransferase domain-containing protein [Bryobacteraceae bacterium]|nr:methyltransferase domain-containing protein [Bryobacteraceae bacterium]
MKPHSVASALTSALTGDGRALVAFPDLATNLERREAGIWFSKSRSAVSYPSHGNQACYQIEDNSFWFQHRNRVITSLVGTFPPAGPLFDIGGGNGFVALALQKAGWQTVVVEPGLTGAMNARHRGLENVVCATLEDTDFRKHSLAAVGIFDVLEHIENAEQFLRTTRELLVERGRIYITVPAYQLLWSPEDQLAGHFCRYSLGSLTSQMRSAGFEVEFASYIFALLPLPIFLRRALPSWLGLHTDAQNAGAEHQTGAEHQIRSVAVQKVMDRVFRWELRRLERQIPIPFGGSCVVVGRS